ncbi:MAG: urease accessory protein UreE [Cellvibrionaceae bacterium]
MFVEVYERLNHTHDPIDDQVVLDHDIRQKGRFKIISKKGTEVRVFLERGKTLEVGEYLKTECGKVIEITGAEEKVIQASCDDWETFSKACYHLGNRHVKIQVGERWLRIKPDYVLEEMLALLGLSLENETAVFLPESGAYSKGHSHHHDDGHHEHDH